MPSSAERGLTVEQTGQRWARERLRRKTVPGARDLEDIRIVKKELADNFFAFPLLGGENAPKWSVRFDPETGMIYVPRWRRARIKLEEGRRVLVGADNFEQLRRPRERRVDFTNLPQKRKVTRLEIMVSDNLESAIRQQRHILDSYEPGRKEKLQVMESMRIVSSLIDRALRRKLDNRVIEELAEQTAESLEACNLTQAKDETKQEIFEALMKAAAPGARINRLVMRIRARSAFLNIISREAIAVLVERKYTANLGILSMKRVVIRRSLLGAIEDLDTLVGITKRGAAVFESKGKPFKGEKRGVEAVIQGMAGSLAEIQLLPYLPVAQSAVTGLVGDKERKPSVVDLVRAGKFSQAKKRIRPLYDSLKGVLEENELIYPQEK